MNILSFDSCCGSFSIAVMHDKQNLAYYKHPDLNQQAELLAVQIDTILHQSNMEISDIDYIAITVGPGSFTGIRVGIALAKGIAAAANIPLIGISTLEVIAFNHRQADVLVALAAGRGRYYTQRFSHGNSVSDIELWSKEQLSQNSQFTIIECDALSSSLNLPDAKDIALLAYEKILRKEWHIPIQPLYSGTVAN
jgi:tRNA threonylcarbamoyl adenosine modification protein YeaZ